MGIYRQWLNILPPHEQDRLRELYKYDILNTPPEDAFDKIAKLAMELFEVAGAFISFVDENTVFLKSDTTGHFERYTNRTDSLCSWAILQDTVAVINNIEEASEILENPEHLKALGIGFYAAAPLQTPD